MAHSKSREEVVLEQGELTITKKSSLMQPPPSPGGRPMNLSRRPYPSPQGTRGGYPSPLHMAAYASPRHVRGGYPGDSPREPVYAELQPVIGGGGQDGRDVIARQSYKYPPIATPTRQPATPTSSSYHLENPNTPCVDSPAPMSVQSNGPASVQVAFAVTPLPLCLCYYIMPLPFLSLCHCL